VLRAIRAGDAVMVKGSLGSRMALIVRALQRAYPHRDPDEDTIEGVLAGASAQG
jgi:UDP-N-acetylmuramoyl-tripeptide--D-alanyl-D-alanine ligase